MGWDQRVALHFPRGLVRPNVHAAAFVFRAVGAVRRISQPCGVDGNQVSQLGLAGVGEGVPSEVLIGEQGVAAMRGNCDSVEAGARGRLGLKAPVSMPVLGEQRALLVGLTPDRSDVLAARDRGKERVDPEGTTAPDAAPPKAPEE